MLLSVSAAAQFNSSGNDPASLRWMQISTDHFRVIYPRGYDSLARVYMDELERWRPAVSGSLGLIQGQFTRRPLDVVLHTLNAASNGAVTWTPSRMEMYTLPQWENPSAMPWHRMLAIHEGRHAAQMQNGYRKVFMPFRYIAGEIFPGVAAAWPGSLILEGDAVIAETGLTATGRGRSGDFLARYMYSLDRGDRRNWMRWRYGSIYHDTPNWYALGYLMISGMRNIYDQPLFSANYFDYVSRRPYDPWPLRHVMRKASGQKFKPTWNSILDYHYGVWKEEADARGPFMSADTISRANRYLTDYSNPNSTPSGDMYWVRNDIYHPATLVRMDSTGREKRLRLTGYIGKMNYNESDSSLIWHELVRNPRWEQDYRSVIRKYTPSTGKSVTLTRPRSKTEGRLIYPVEAAEGQLAAIAYHPDGSCSIEFIDSHKGSAISGIPVPAGLQPVQITYFDSSIYAATLSEGGFGIWRWTDGSWTEILPAIPVHIASLENDGTYITFESDHGGIWEFYRMTPDGSRVMKVSNTRYGGDDFGLCDNGDLSYSSMCDSGSQVMMIRKADLALEEVQWQQYHRYPVADSLSAQEKALAAGSDAALTAAIPDSISISEPKPYRKFPHGFRFHSWAPVYVDYNAIANQTFDDIRNLASLGAMGFFQNSMNTLSGWIGYKAAPDANGRWWHSGHLDLKYSGLYPVFELKAHVGEREAAELYHPADKPDTTMQRSRGVPMVRVSLNTYVPLRWSGQGVHYGLIPNVSIGYRNDVYYGQQWLKYSTGLQAYVMQSTPKGCVYPRWGVGGQAVWSDPLAFFYLYGYIPGFTRGQGFRLTAIHQMLSNPDGGLLYSYANTLPRGFADAETGGTAYLGTKLTAEYAIPFYMGDWRIGDAFLCRRGIVTPHFDYSMLKKGTLASVGASFEMEFGCFAWIKSPVSIGITYSYNFGSMLPEMKLKSPHYYGVLFSIDIPE